MTQRSAELLIHSSRVHTMTTEPDGGADAVAIADGLVIAVGSREALQAHVSPDTRILEYPGATIVPGLVDSHMHPIYSLSVARGLSLVGVSSFEELTAILEQNKQEDQEWFFAWGLDPNVFEGRAIDNTALHEVLGADRPAYVKSFDAHSAIASAAALARAGIDRPFTADNGAAAVDDGTGSPSGLLLEFPAMDILESAAPSPTFRERLQRLRQLLNDFAAQGITMGHVMDLKDSDALDLLRALEAEGDLPIRLRISPWCEPEASDEEVERIVSLQGTRGRRFVVEGVKLFLDGTVEGGTAWLDSPDADGQSASSTWADSDAYRRRISRLHADGVPTATHAIGERAIRFAARTLAALPPNGTRHRIEHLESMTDDALALMVVGRIAASMQPTHCTHYIRADGSDDWSRRLGPMRARRAWRTGDIRRAGLSLALGSDWPVAAFNPWEIMADARLRRPVADPDLEPVLLDQQLSAREALEGYTTHAHHSVGADGGVLEPGRVADLVVVDVDPLAATPERVSQARSLLTVVDGCVVHSDSVTRG